MICDKCGWRKGVPWNSTSTECQCYRCQPPKHSTECECYMCQPNMCARCQKKSRRASDLFEGSKPRPHKKPNRREAVLATQRKL